MTTKSIINNGELERSSLFRMDWRQILLNILNELRKNVEILFNLAEVFSEEDVEHNFFIYLHNSLAYSKITMRKPTNWSQYRIADLFIQRLHQVEMDISTFQTAGNCYSKKRPKRRGQSKNLHEIEINFQTEQKLRLDLIADLQHRLAQINKKEASNLNVAKICSEKARQDIEKKYKEPKEELQLQCQMLETKLTIQLAENAVTYQQLVKCRTTVNSDIEELTRKMEVEAQTAESLLTQLRSETQEATAKLAELTGELKIVSIQYEQVVEEKRIRMEKREQMEMEMRRREAAAILIQRWFRVQCFRRMSRRKKKLKRFKIAANSKQEQPVGRTNKLNVANSPMRNMEPNSNLNNSKKPILRPKKRSQKEEIEPRTEVEEKTVQVTDGCSQTDGRIPVSKNIPLF